MDNFDCHQLSATTTKLDGYFGLGKLGMIMDFRIFRDSNLIKRVSWEVSISEIKSHMESIPVPDKNAALGEPGGKRLRRGNPTTASCQSVAPTEPQAKRLCQGNSVPCLSRCTAHHKRKREAMPVPSQLRLIVSCDVPTPASEELQVACDAFNKLLDAGVDMRQVDAFTALIDAGVDMPEVVVWLAKEKKKTVREQKRKSLQMRLKRITIITSPSFLLMPSEIQLKILKSCDPTTLCRLDQVCKVLSMGKSRSLLRTAVEDKLRSECPYMQCSADSLPVTFAKIHKLVPISTLELGQVIGGSAANRATAALRLSDPVCNGHRTRITTMRLLRALGCPAKAAMCVEIITELSRVDRGSVVAAGALPHLVRLLRPDGSKPTAVGMQATRALFVISNDAKYLEQIVGAGAVTALAYILKEGSIGQRRHACCALYRMIRGVQPIATQATASLVDAGAIGALMDLLTLQGEELANASARVQQRAILDAARLVCGISCNSSVHCAALQAAGILDPLDSIMAGSKKQTQAYAVQTLLDIACRNTVLQVKLALLLCHLLREGGRMLVWFDLARGLGVLAGRFCYTGQAHQEFADAATQPLLGVVMGPGALNPETERYVLMGLATLVCATNTLVHVVEGLLHDSGLLQTGECEFAKTRVTRLLCIIVQKRHAGPRDPSRGYHSTIISDIDPVCIESAIPPLLQQLTCGSAGAKMYSAGCLAFIANEVVHIDAVVASGATPCLLSILYGPEPNIVKQYAARTIGNIATQADHAAEFLNRGVVTALVALLAEEYDLNGGEFAAHAIASFTLHSGLVDLVVQQGVVGPLVHVLHTDSVLAGPVPLQGKALLQHRGIAFTQAWVVVALLAITGSAKHCQDQGAIGAPHSFKMDLENCSCCVKLELARAILETTEKHNPQRLEQTMTKTLLNELVSSGNVETKKHAKETMRNLGATT